MYLKDIIKTDNEPDIITKIIDSTAPKFKKKKAEPIPHKVLQVIMIVSDLYDVSVPDILGNRRITDHKVARHVAMNRIFEMGGSRAKNSNHITMKMIGRWFGGKDHSTVINAINNVKNWSDCYEDFRIQYNTLCRATSHIMLGKPVALTLEERIQRLPEDERLGIIAYIEKLERTNG